EAEAKRDWGPELRAETGRRQGGESRWLREEGDPNWVAPNPVLMSNQCSSNKGAVNSGNNVANHDKGVMNNNDSKDRKMQL
ncbi:hypothetical protein A2U01_0092808, partial [Trifolium medium]|nr:hypothetical protein [Trifolium medium]